ncbi:Gfo/Idh/MocA family oxidoreductase [Mesorhizobium sp. M1409]|uniref:Gfo/Idh/MocA family protein n=1 Tax=unclassified Mesorhizobium TaxID=325217 RepID=UPI0033361550
MTQEEIRVGIIGADTRSSWAKVSHIPAINGLPGLKLAAVATRNEQSAREAAKAFGAERWFSDPFEMIRDDRIDLVTIAVKVPAHRELVLAALQAGKAVYCEAPLGRSVAEAEEMARAAGSNHTAIGLQGRHNPAARRAAELVSSGKIGRPLSARIVSPTYGFGPEIPLAHDFFNKASSGANLLTICGGHTVDLVEAVLGQIVEVDARTEIRWPMVKLRETGEESVRETADYVGVIGKTRSGTAFTADFDAGGQGEQVRFTFDIRGSEGWLSLTSDHPYGFQAGDLRLVSNIPFVAPDRATVTGGLMGAAVNVGEIYAGLARDLRAGAYSTPGFGHAVHNARLIEAVRRAADRGERQIIPNREE